MIQQRGQSLVEYVILMVCAAALLLTGMVGYVRSAISHHVKGGADGIGQGLLYRP